MEYGNKPSNRLERGKSERREVPSISKLLKIFWKEVDLGLEVQFFQALVKLKEIRG
jgi:hypothetical protein